MKISQFKKHLESIDSIQFVQTDGEFIPQHFHITEAGLTTKHFIDCGGTVRTEKVASVQVWVAQDVDHRLAPSKLLSILGMAEGLFGQDDMDIEVEYQQETIGRYGIEFKDDQFALMSKQTDCLAKDHCGIPIDKLKLPLSELTKAASACCAPGGGCC